MHCFNSHVGIGSSAQDFDGDLRIISSTNFVSTGLNVVNGIPENNVGAWIGSSCWGRFSRLLRIVLILSLK